MNILNIVKLIALAIVFLIGASLVFISIYIRTEPPRIKQYFVQKLADVKFKHFFKVINK